MIRKNLSKKPFTDILGNEIKVGDVVAVACIDYRSPELRIGKILEITDKPQPDRWNYQLQVMSSVPPKRTVKIEWDKDLSPSGVPDKPTSTEKLTARFLKIK